MRKIATFEGNHHRSVVQGRQQPPRMTGALSLVYYPEGPAGIKTNGIQSAGLVGAVTAVVLVRVLDAAITSTMIGRRVGLRLSDLRSLTPIMRITAVAAAAGLFTFLVRQALVTLPAIVTFGICSAVFTAVFLVLAFVAGAVPDHEKLRLHTLLRRSNSSSRFGLSSASDV